MAANERQVGGGHYKGTGEEHWDRVDRLGLDYYQGQITKYVERCWEKGGVTDLEKAAHFLEKYIELAKNQQSRVFQERVGPRFAEALDIATARSGKVAVSDRVSGRKIRPARTKGKS